MLIQRAAPLPNARVRTRVIRVASGQFLYMTFFANGHVDWFMA